MKINEIFGSSEIYQVAWKWGSADDVEAYGTFTTSDGRMGKILFQEMSVEPQVVDFEFEVGKTKGISGGGDQYAIFNTVIQAFETYLKTKKPEYVTFSAKEPNRFRIYAKLVNKLIGGHGLGKTGYQWLSKDNFPDNMPLGYVDFVIARDARRQFGMLPSVRQAQGERNRAEQQYSGQLRNESIVDEAQMDSGIKKEMTKQGYEFLGDGEDQDVYLAPDGTILKIFGYETDSRGTSEGQRSFIDFANFCMANPNNPFLPQFGGWQKFTFKGQGYLQIKCERLFEAPYELSDLLSDLVDRIDIFNPKQAIEKFMHWEVDNDSNPDRAGKLITMIGGEQKLMLFAQTVKELSNLGRKRGYGLDLHSGNFMLGSDGEIVINDPFFTGTMRR